MTTSWLSNQETDLRKIVTAVQQLQEGRSNATGSVTLSTGVTTTTVTAPTCGAGSVIKLSPQTANAAAALTTSYIQSTDITPRQFVITHTTSTSTDRTFGWVAIG